MATTRSKAATGEDRPLDAAERKDAEGFLRRAHDEAELWRRCPRPRCRHARTCAGDVDECGDRCFPEGWAWVRGMARALRDGRPPGAAAKAADRRVADLENEGAFGRKPPRTRIIDLPYFNEKIERVTEADGRVSIKTGPLRPDLPWSPGRLYTWRTDGARDRNEADE